MIVQETSCKAIQLRFTYWIFSIASSLECKIRSLLFLRNDLFISLWCSKNKMFFKYKKILHPKKDEEFAVPPLLAKKCSLW